MQTKEVLQFALIASDDAVMTEIDKMKDDLTQFPTPKGGCHPLWVMGHLTLVEGMIPAVLFGEENPVAGWHALFGEDSESVSDINQYPRFSEIRTKYNELRAKNVALLASLSEMDLDKPTMAPPKGREREFATFGSSFLALALHQAMHRSHVTDALRAAGRQHL